MNLNFFKQGSKQVRRTKLAFLSWTILIGKTTNAQLYNLTEDQMKSFTVAVGTQATYNL